MLLALYLRKYLMLNKAVKYFIAGLVIPYVGMWFAGTFMLGSGATPNFLPMQVVSLFTILFSIGLYYLSKIEKRKHISVLCVLTAAIYAVMHFGILIPQDNPQHYIWFQGMYLMKIVIGVLAGVVLLETLKEFQSEI